jgi:ATP synthase protein I
MPRQKPAPNPAEWIRQLALALDLPFVLLGTIVAGGLIGYFLDSWLHTKPWLMLLFGALGFVGGLRTVLRTLATRNSGSGAGKPPGGSNA